MSEQDHPSNHEYQPQQEQDTVVPKRRREFTMPGHILLADKTQQQMRRWFGWNFIFVLMVLIVFLTFVWPLLFRKQDRYIAETAVRNSYTLISHLRENVSALTAPTPENVIDMLSAHPVFKPAENKVLPQVFIIDSAGALQLNNAELPPYWSEIEINILTAQRGVEVYNNKEIMSVIFFDTLPGTQLKIIINHPYRGMFASD